jgi:D-inositol-3-phosphate glycosyltransferase
MLETKMTTLGMLCRTARFFERSHQRSHERILDRILARLERIAVVPNETPIQGATVATKTFLRALISHAKLDKYLLFAAPNHVEPIKKAIQAGRNSWAVGDRVKVASFLDLVRWFDTYKINGWLDLEFNFEAPSLLRRRLSSRLFPITVTHHSISYQRLLRNDFIPMVLAESYPFDSIVCTSRSARTAIETILDRTSTEVNRELRVDARFRGRLEVIPFGIDTDRFRPRPKELARSQLGLARELFIILYHGRLSPVDKADLIPLMRVYRELVTSNPKLSLLLVIAGGQAGHYRDSLACYVRESHLNRHVKFIVKPEDPAVIYSAADLFVSPVDNIQESFGLTVVEAMACGLPQVVSDWDGYRDTVIDGQTGFLIPTYWMRCDSDICEAAPLFGPSAIHDHAALAQSVAVDLRVYRERLQQLITNHDLRVEMGRRSRERAVSVFAWEIVMRQYQRLWAEMEATAATSNRSPRSYASSVHPHYYEAFGHNASHEISLATPLRITDAGTRPGSILMQPYQLAYNLKLLDQQLLEVILRAVRLKETNISEIAMTLHGLTEYSTYHSDFVYRHVMWLMKYGLIEIVP